LGNSTSDERRHNLRISCNVPVRCESSGGIFEGRLKDVSLQGLRLELPQRLERGAQLSIHRPSVNLDPVQAVVRWCRRHSRREVLLAGLEVQMEADAQQRSWVHPILSTFLYLHPDSPIEPSLQHPVPESKAGSEACQEELTALPEAPANVTISPYLQEVMANEAALQQVDEQSQTQVGAENTASEPLPLESTSEPVTDDTQQTEPELSPASLEVSFERDHSDEEWSALLRSAQERLLSLRDPLLNKLLKGFREFAFEDTASVTERRRCARLTCDYEVSLKSSAGPMNATILDLSPAGIALLAPRKLSRNTPVEVQSPANLIHSGSLRCNVRYCRTSREQFRIGLEMRGDLLPSWLNPALRELGFSNFHLEQKRRFVRAQTALPIEVRNWRGDFENSTLLDLSRGGAMLRSQQSWEVGEVLRLILGPIGFLPVLFLRAVVLNQRPEGDSWLVHLSFIDLDGTNLARIDRYVRTILSQK
jgi:hypothetical protein